MTIPKEIQKAIEGGWAEARLEELPNWKVASRTSTVFWKEFPLVRKHKIVLKQRQYLQMSSIALDPAFWIALGKVFSWDETYSTDYWQGQAYTFHRLLFTNRPTDSFWAEILQGDEPASKFVPGKCTKVYLTKTSHCLLGPWRSAQAVSGKRIVTTDTKRPAHAHFVEPDSPAF
jgi:hypothetical protein